jgi:hypothetical protein
VTTQQHSAVAAIGTNVHRELERVTSQLAREHPEVTHEQIRELVNTAEASLAGARITQFIPILVRSSVLAELRRSAG